MTNLSTLFPAVPTYTPAMMQFDGSTGYYSKSSITTSGNKITLIIRINIASFSGGGSERVGEMVDTGTGRFYCTARSNDFANVDERNKLNFFVQSSTPTTICSLWSETDVMDGADHTIMFSFDGDAGTAQLVVDGVVEDDTGVASRVAPATGTLSASSTSALGVGGSSGGAQLIGGDIGYFGYVDAYLTNWSDFMQADGSPKALDESTWTEWGAQPLFWNEHGDMENNLGSAGNMTRNGLIVVGKGGN